MGEKIAQAWTLHAWRGVVYSLACVEAVGKKECGQPRGAGHFPKRPLRSGRRRDKPGSQYNGPHSPYSLASTGPKWESIRRIEVCLLRNEEFFCENAMSQPGPHGRRKLRIFKWVGLVACVLIAMPFVLSFHWGIMFSWGNYSAACESAHVIAGYSKVVDRAWEVQFYAGVPGPFWGPFSATAAGGRWVILSLWFPLALIGLPTIVAWRRDRGYPTGHCSKCGYDLTGNVSGVCPESGTETKPT